jgi:hypothetical protein
MRGRRDARNTPRFTATLAACPIGRGAQRLLDCADWPPGRNSSAPSASAIRQAAKRAAQLAVPFAGTDEVATSSTTERGYGEQRGQESEGKEGRQSTRFDISGKRPTRLRHVNRHGAARSAL